MDISTQKDRRPGQKYSRIVNKIQKGFTAAYPTQSSIPVKYKSSVIPESEKKGFNSQAKRFYQKTDDIPGPGFYNVTHQSPVSNSVSLSRRGTCTFPSMRARLDIVVSKYPAANAYTLPSRLVSKQDFSNSCSSMFQLPSFGKVLKTETPAPNHYNNSNTLDALKCIVCGLTSILHFWRGDKDQGGEGTGEDTTPSFSPQASLRCCKQRNNVTARAGFVSKTQRGFCTTAERAPAPGHYNINESLVKPSPKVLMSCFKSKTGRGFKVTSTGPGPGYYSPNEHIKIPTKTVIPRNRGDVHSPWSGQPMFPTNGSGCQRGERRNPSLKLSTPPPPPPLALPLPGPGQYEIVDYNGPPKLFVSSASFVSNTSRWTAAPTQSSLPGPATYQPEFPGKQSFLYNEDNKWIPVL